VKIAIQTTVPASLYTFFRGQLTWLKSHDFEVHTISAPGEELQWVAEAEKVTTHAVAMTRSFSPLRDPLALWSLIRLYRKSRFTVVHSFTPKGGLLGMLAAAAAGCPVRLFTLWGMAPTAINFRTRMRVWANKVSCALAHKIFIECPSTAELAVASGLCSREKVVVVPAWSTNTLDSKLVDLSDLAETRAAARHDWGLPPESVVIGFVGRVVRDKGVHELMKAFENLASEFPELHLLVVGVREAEDPVGQDILRRMDQHPRICCTGFQKNVKKSLSAMDILVHPSYREGLPTAPLEASARGLPVIVTRIPGCIDAVQEGVTGLLVEPRDAPGLAEAIRYYLKNPDVRQQHGRNGRGWVLKKYDREVAWMALLNEYQKILAERGIFPLSARAGDPQT
jgi:glycosyltransferase involved in cell wall biosynthesis